MEYRVDKTANLHVPFGKRDFETEALLDNLAAVVDSIMRNRPASSKGSYIRKAYITTTMSPSARIDTSDLIALRTRL